MISDFLIRISADGQGFFPTLRKMQEETKNLEKGIGLLSKTFQVIGSSAVVGFAKSVGDAAERMLDLSSKTKVAVEEFQGLEFAAARANIPLDTLVRIMQELRESQGKALSGDEAKQRAFDRLGIPKERLSEQTPQSLLNAVNRRVQGGTTPEDDAAIIKVAGQQITEILPKLSNNLSETAEAFNSLGVAMDEASVRQFAESADAFKGLFVVIKSVFGNLFSGVMSLPRLALLGISQIGGRSEGRELPSGEREGSYITSFQDSLALDEALAGDSQYSSGRRKFSELRARRLNQLNQRRQSIIGEQDSLLRSVFTAGGSKTDITTIPQSDRNSLLQGINGEVFRRQLEVLNRIDSGIKQLNAEAAE